MHSACQKEFKRGIECVFSILVIIRTSLHASGIRLRNAQDWGKPGWTHSKPGRQIIVQ